jgi:acetyltransferase-like isoleucine patch superfamily enzyme
MLMAHGITQNPRAGRNERVTVGDRVGLRHEALVRRGIKESARSFVAIPLAERFTTWLRG